MESENAHQAPVGAALIADDDGDFRQLLARRARRTGLQVVEAADGAQALRLLDSQDFDVLVLDVYMPGASGLEVFQHARRKQADVQAIFLTGSASLETAVDALRKGAYDYLTKPLDSLAAFELALTRALEHRHLLRENARLFEEVQRLAITDPLTGLFNRHRLADVLETECERAARYGRPVSMIMIDLDDLKGINDTYGHTTGDSVLRAVGDAVRRTLRKLDLPTRFGGDEFLVVLPETYLEDAQRVALRISQEIALVRVGEVGVTASTGVVQWSSAYRSSDDFMGAVDRALYEAKHQGGGAIAVVPLTGAPVG